MARAFRLARRGEGRVEPNPMVGCVLVKRGRVVGEGWHHRFGGAHAEIFALRQAGPASRGATAYVTLEPCCHTGKTGPCTVALIAAGVSRVVAAIEDPNPLVGGRGIAALRRAGIDVTTGVGHDQAVDLAAPFLKRMLTGRPWVIAKWAQSLDGKLATRTGDSRWISDEVMRAHAHRVRGRMDAIVVGVETVFRDDPLLTARSGRLRRVAIRVVVDSKLRTPPNANLVRTAGKIPTWIACTPRAPRRSEQRLRAHGCRVLRLRQDSSGLVSLTSLLDEFGTAQFSNVLLEGGGQLLGSFFDHKLIDEMHAYVCPLLIGGADAPGAWQGRGAARIHDALRLDGMRLRRLGSGWLVDHRWPQARAHRRGTRRRVGPAP